MDVEDAIKNRRSIRDYKEEDITYEEILNIIECSYNFPKAGGIDHHHIIIVKNKETIAKISEISQQDFIKKASALLVICSDDEKLVSLFGNEGKKYALQQSGAFIENILLCLVNKNLGGCWIGYYDENKVKNILSIPKNISVHAIITIGVPNENPKNKESKPLSEIISFERYGNKKYKPDFYPLLNQLNKIIEYFKEIKKL